jgi:hypothetical protein
LFIAAAGNGMSWALNGSAALAYAGLAQLITCPQVTA